MRRVRADGAELDGPIHHRSLEGSAEELSAPVSLDALDGKRELFEYMLSEEAHSVLRCAPRVERDDTHPRAIIDGGELEEPRRDFHRVHLHAFAGHIAAVRLWLSGGAPAPQTIHAVTVEHLPDRGSRELERMQADQLGQDASRAEVTLRAHLGNPADVLVRQLTAG